MTKPVVHFLTDPALFRAKENWYLQVRQREGRILSDEMVLGLPDVAPSGADAQEWRWRRRSLARLEEYLTQKFAEKTCRILDLGCGNGWMANRLAESRNRDVWAVDLNEPELAQGARLFGRDNLRFVYADVLADVLPPQHFDAVVMAASVQYFPDLPELFRALCKTLKPGGEIHFLDSHFYKNEALRADAQQRTRKYYAELGFPEMAAFYHHHRWDEVAGLGGQHLNRSLATRFLQKIKWLAPFAWVRVRV